MVNKGQKMIDCKLVYGPRGCGKTRNSETLMRKLDCTRAVDIDDTGDLQMLSSDVLALTNDPGIAGALNYFDVMAEG